MRPVEKFPVGRDIEVDGQQIKIQSDYPHYQDAKPLLADNLGEYCSYCEIPVQDFRALAVEHVQPKGLPQYEALATSWDNLSDSRQYTKIGEAKTISLPDCCVSSENLFLYRKIGFTDTAQRTFEILRQLFKRCTRSDTGFRHSNRRVVNPTTNITYVLFHNLSFFVV